jgi:hypothetical protein
MSTMVYKPEEPDRSPLSADERRHYEVARDTVRNGLRTFLAVGAALLAIRDGRWYREDYDTFDQFLPEEFGISRQRGHQLIRCVQVVEDLEPPPAQVSVSAVVYREPESERQVRPLVPLAPEQRRTAWEMACEEAGPDRQPTGREVEAAVRRVAGEPAAPRPVVRVAIDPADLKATARDIVAALGNDIDAVNRLIRAVADAVDDPRCFWIQGKRLRPRRG